MSKRLQKIHDKWGDHKLSGLPGAEEVMPHIIWSTVVSLDPTPNHKYVDWALMAWARGAFKWEDVKLGAESRVAEQLKRFETNKHRIADPAMRSLMKYRSPGEMDRILDEHGVAREAGFFDLSSNQQKKAMMAKARLESHHIVLDSGVTFDIPITQFASCILGRNTRWCTAASKGNQFEDYARNGPLIIITLPTGERFQTHSDLRSSIIAEAHPEFTILNAEDATLTSEERSAIRPHIDDISDFITKAYSNILIKTKDMENGKHGLYVETSMGPKNVADNFPDIFQKGTKEYLKSVLTYDSMSYHKDDDFLKNKFLNMIKDTRYLEAVPSPDGKDTYRYRLTKSENISWRTVFESDFLRSVSELIDKAPPAIIKDFRIDIPEDAMKEMVNSLCTSNMIEPVYLYKLMKWSNIESNDQEVIKQSILKLSRNEKATLNIAAITGLMNSASLQTMKEILENKDTFQLYISNQCYRYILMKCEKLEDFFDILPDVGDSKRFAILLNTWNGIKYDKNISSRLIKEIHAFFRSHMSAEYFAEKMGVEAASLSPRALEFKRNLMVRQQKNASDMKKDALYFTLEGGPVFGDAVAYLYEHYNGSLGTEDIRGCTPEQVRILQCMGFVDMGLPGEFVVPDKATQDMTRWDGKPISPVVSQSAVLGLMGVDELHTLKSEGMTPDMEPLVKTRINNILSQFNDKEYQDKMDTLDALKGDYFEHIAGAISERGYQVQKHFQDIREMISDSLEEIKVKTLNHGVSLQA